MDKLFNFEQDIIEAYSNLETMIGLANKYGVSRQAIFKLLKRKGIDTSKHKLKIKCGYCRKEILRHKFRIRKQINNFCNSKCYFAFLNKGITSSKKYKPSRWGQMKAREIVSKYIKLLPGYVVHYVDRNCNNNKLHNLVVFRSQADHMKWHRGAEAKPIWQGSSIITQTNKSSSTEILHIENLL